MRSALLACALMLGLVLALAGQAQAAPGDLDSSFSFDGKQTTDFAGSYDLGKAVAVQADGKIVVAGYSGQGDATRADFALARYVGASRRCDQPGSIRGTGAGETINGTPGDDIICGFGGNDTINGKGGSDQILGGEGDDTLHGGDPASPSDSADSRDRLFGQEGDDRLFGDAGGDGLYPGNDTDADSVDGGEGTDAVHYNDRSSAVQVLIDGLPNDGALAGGEGDNVTTTVENAFTGSGNDRLVGSSGPNALDGGRGADDITGDPAGPGARDSLYGRDDNDTLRSAGDGVGDRNYCGTGSDTFFADAFDLTSECETPGT